MLTPADETNLLTALFSGPLEQPYWTRFLDRLMKRTRADHAGLMILRPGQPMADAPRWFAGRDLREAGGLLNDPVLIDPAAYQRLRPGRVYGTMELFDPRVAEPIESHSTRSEQQRIGHGRYMRVVEQGGINCWLTLLRERSDFSAADSSVLSSLGPHVAVALQILAALEAGRLKLAAADAALERAGVSWGIVDAEVRPAQGDSDHATPVVTIPLPAPDYVTQPTDNWIAIARCARPATPAQIEAAMAHFGLTRSEARLALHLVGGHSLQDAGAMLNLTRETARNYSKRLYEKTGSRGQADLVRRILTSVVTLA